MASGRWGPLVVMARRVGRHELIDRGAALTYYSVLSLIPGLLVLFSVIGLFGDQGTVERRARHLRRRGAVRTARRRARRRSNRWSRTTPGRAPCSGVGLLAVLWTASAYIGCFFRASADDLGSRAPAGVARVAAARRAHDASS